MTNVSNATMVSNGKDLWISDVGKFNGDVFNEFTEKLFGTQDWVKYVKTMTDTQTESYVIPASTINASIGNENYGMVVKLGDLYWILTSLTLTEDGKEDVVATLYLADSTQITTSYFSHSGTKGDTMYSRSILRNTLLASADFKLFSDDSTGGFADRFLVQPKNIKYQTNQTIYGRYSTWMNMGNEALGEPLNGKWDSGGKYSPGDTYDGIKYEDWGEDRIWIPSLTETGASNGASTSCIWKLSNSQRASSKSSWLRSGARGEYKNVYYMKNDATMSWALTTASTYVLRPAIHLNLTQAAKNISAPTIVKPTDTKKYYSETDGVANDVTFELENVDKDL
ncbi:MAG: hypothetical protein K2I78_00705, partial [Clostridia bacterium]|nr:hypothetical protein [Clostridia bacterium]